MEQLTREELQVLLAVLCADSREDDTALIAKLRRMRDRTPEGQERRYTIGGNTTITEAEWNEQCSKGWMDRTFGREKSGQPGEECTSAPSGREKNSDSDEPDGFREEHGFWRGGDYYSQRTSSTSGEPSDEQEKQE
jgi:hypothetical protein